MLLPKNMQFMIESMTRTIYNTMMESAKSLQDSGNNEENSIMMAGFVMSKAVEDMTEIEEGPKTFLSNIISVLMIEICTTFLNSKETGQEPLFEEAIQRTILTASYAMETAFDSMTEEELSKIQEPIKVPEVPEVSPTVEKAVEEPSKKQNIIEDIPMLFPGQGMLNIGVKPTREAEA